MADDTDRPATAGDVKRVIRRKIARREQPEEVGLNIYPMMDMMTILLVFLIQSFASGAAEIVQSEELQIPISNAQVDAAEALGIVISQSEVVVEGKRVLSLRNGKVDPSLKQGGGNGWLITPLYNALKQHRDRLKVIAAKNPQRAFRGEVRLVADKRTPFRTLGEVIYSLGQAEFGALRFIVLKQGSSG
ncbi:MAG TPA: biopolymer transporter ExbD [Polyangiales bacterium]|nr:biopolymer transporter ExbD [Polyangiales bacterium]